MCKPVAKIVCLTAMMMFMFTGTAQAGLVQQTQTDFSSSFSFNPFNGALGTLTAVSVGFNNLSADFSGQDPIQLCVAFGDCEGTINLSITTTGGALELLDGGQSLSISNAQVDAGFNETLSFPNASFSFLNLADFLSPNFIGSTLIESFATGDLALNNFRNLSIGAPTGSLTLNYTFEEGAQVPAPATLALFGLGLAGLGWSRRKKA